MCWLKWMKVVGVDDSNRTTMITNIVAHWYICLVESVKWRKKPYELGRIRKINGRKGEATIQETDHLSLGSKEGGEEASFFGLHSRLMHGHRGCQRTTTAAPTQSGTLRGRRGWLRRLLPNWGGPAKNKWSRPLHYCSTNKISKIVVHDS